MTMVRGSQEPLARWRIHLAIHLDGGYERKWVSSRYFHDIMKGHRELISFFFV